MNTRGGREGWANSAQWDVHILGISCGKSAVFLLINIQTKFVPAIGACQLGVCVDNYASIPAKHNFAVHCDRFDSAQGRPEQCRMGEGKARSLPTGQAGSLCCFGHCEAASERPKQSLLLWDCFSA